MDQQGIPYEALAPAGIADRWPLRPRPDFVGLFEPTAGAILADQVLALFEREARGMGVDVRVGCRAERIDATGADVRVVDQWGEVHGADKVVIAAGPWSPSLLAQLGVQLAVEVWGMLWAHYEVDATRAHDYPQWFCFTRGDEAQGDGGLYYGFPVLGSGEPPLIKAGIDWAPEELRVSRIEQLPRETPPSILRQLDAFMADGLVGVGRRRDAHLSPYTMTRDVGFILDRVPGHEDRVLTFTGGSGQAFKFAPLIGALLADLALDRAPRADITPWSIRRDAVQA